MLPLTGKIIGKIYQIRNSAGFTDVISLLLRYNPEEGGIGPGKRSVEFPELMK